MIRYTITFTDRPGSKTRYRQALKMMGAESVKIVEMEIDPAVPKEKPDNTPSTDLSKAVATLFSRKHDTAWADEEIKAYKDTIKTGLLTMETIALVANFYKVERKREGNFCRTSLLTFCRHFGTELDKARAAKPTNGHALEWTDSRPKIAVLPDPDEEERIRAAAKQHAEEFRKGIA